MSRRKAEASMEPWEALRLTSEARAYAVAVRILDDLIESYQSSLNQRGESHK